MGVAGLVSEEEESHPQLYAVNDCGYMRHFEAW